MSNYTPNHIGFGVPRTLCGSEYNLHMQDINPIQEAPQSPQIMWYRARAGKIFLSILFFILILTLGFFALTGYYVWQIKFGVGAEKLAEDFNPRFTADPSKSNLSSSNAITEDLNKFIYPTTPILGQVKAPITIFTFIDFECPFSQAGYPIFKEITEKYAPIVKIVFKHLPVESIFPNAMQAHLASACAAEQEKFWEYYDLLLTNKKLGSSDLLEYANKLNLDEKKFGNCLDSKKYQNNIDQDIIDSIDLGIRGTPTYFVNKTKIEGVITKDLFEKIILEQMRKNL